jgi:hypothetical protein
LANSNLKHEPASETKNHRGRTKAGQPGRHKSTSP